MKTPFWLTLVIMTGVLSLVIVGLTLGSENAAASGTNPGRMALSFAVLLVLVAVILGIPTVFIGVRENLGRLPFLHTYLLAVAIGLSFVIAATPALLLAVFAGNIPVAVWLPVLGTTKLEVWVLALLVALAHWAITHHRGAVATAFGLIVGITIGPLLVVMAASFAPPVHQNTSYIYVQWTDENQEIDPKTGYPVNPTCQKPSYSKTTATDYTGVWAAIETNPVALVSSSVLPVVADYIAPSLTGNGWEANPVGMPAVTLPVDLFATIDLRVREMQLPVPTRITIDECANLKKYGTPYVTQDGKTAPDQIIAKSTSGYPYGLIGQAAYLALAAAVLIPIRVRSRRS